VKVISDETLEIVIEAIPSLFVIPLKNEEKKHNYDK
jgi:hypothetical protein